MLLLCRQHARSVTVYPFRAYQKQWMTCIAPAQCRSDIHGRHLQKSNLQSLMCSAPVRFIRQNRDLSAMPVILTFRVLASFNIETPTCSSSRIRLSVQEPCYDQGGSQHAEQVSNHLARRLYGPCGPGQPHLSPVWTFLLSLSMAWWTPRSALVIVTANSDNMYIPRLRCCIATVKHTP